MKRSSGFAVIQVVYLQDLPSIEHLLETHDEMSSSVESCRSFMRDASFRQRALGDSLPGLMWLAGVCGIEFVVRRFNAWELNPAPPIQGYLVSGAGTHGVCGRAVRRAPGIQ